MMIPNFQTCNVSSLFQFVIDKLICRETGSGQSSESRESLNGLNLGNNVVSVHDRFRFERSSNIELLAQIWCCDSKTFTSNKSLEYSIFILFM